MISIDYKHKEIEVNIGEIPSYISTPLTLKIVNPVSKRVTWEVELDTNSWAKYLNTEKTDSFTAGSVLNGSLDPLKKTHIKIWVVPSAD